MNNIDQKTVAECVAENYKAADIFKKRGIDFCCGGQVSVKEICDRKQVDYNEVRSELLQIDNVVDSAHDFLNWELDTLIDYIMKVHHEYVKNNIPLIKEYANKVAKVHGHHYTETVEINRLFSLVADELESHMHKEEIILFPYISNIAEAKKEGMSIPMPPFGSIENPIRMMEHEHNDVGDLTKRIAELSNSYTPPAEACNTYRVLYAKLKEFENDLFQHIHLENNILFPKAIKLEKELKEKIC